MFPFLLIPPQACHDEFMPLVDKVKSQVYLDEEEKKVIQSKHDAMCRDKNIYVLQGELKRNHLHCITSYILNRQTQRAGVDYCYHSYYNSSTPSTDEDWLSLTCSTSTNASQYGNRVETQFCITQIYMSSGSRVLLYDHEYIRCLTGYSLGTFDSE